jgi:hypothetical protein
MQLELITDEGHGDETGDGGDAKAEDTTIVTHFCRPLKIGQKITSKELKI